MTTRCNLPGCVMCPRTAWPDRWQARDLSWDTFEALIASARFFSHVHLSGWGEPLLHPRLWEMARLLKAQGLKVSLTTNGLGLSEEAQRQALEHLEMVAISLDGARAETYETLRPGGDFHRLTANIAALCSRKRSLGLKKPEVVLRFLKMRPNLAELPELVKLAASLGVDRVNAPNLDFIPVPEMEPLSLWPSGPPDPEMAARQREAEEAAMAVSIPLRNFSLSPTLDLRVCDANPLLNAFVTVSGEVAPCVYLGLPVAGSFRRHYLDKVYQVGNYSYGNIRKLDFVTLSRQPAYLNFIDYFRGPVEIFALLQPASQEARSPAGGLGTGRACTFSGRWPPSCQGCLKNIGL
ncbi:MAG: radical SAM/SPASM domain-containing protein [Thermodesulfobacteriota bacterium]